MVSYYYNLIFKLKIYESHGEQFQQFMNRFFVYYYGERYQSVAPYGNEGDGGNDGFIPNDKHYFQMYAPKPNSQSKFSDIKSKITEDLKKIVRHWGEVLTYHFVVNDRFMGIQKNIYDHLEAMRNKYKLKETKVIDTIQLHKRFNNLDNKDKIGVCDGVVPLADIGIVESSVLSALLKHLADTPLNYTAIMSNANAPDFNEKIKLNKLHSFIASRLQTNSYHIQEIDDFFSSHMGATQAISEILKSKYEESKLIFPESEVDRANLQYFWMAESLCPKEVKLSHVYIQKAYRDAAELVLAKYFEACDIYEHPSSFTPA